MDAVVYLTTTVDGNQQEQTTLESFALVQVIGGFFKQTRILIYTFHGINVIQCSTKPESGMFMTILTQRVRVQLFPTPCV